MIWDLYQTHGIHEARRTAGKAASRAEDAASEVARLKRQVDHLTLSCQAMWELLRQATGLTDEKLREHILEVDLRDGQADGRIAAQPMTCAKCGHRTNSRRKTCLMCGGAVDRDHLFE